MGKEVEKFAVGWEENDLDGGLDKRGMGRVRGE